MIAKTELHYKLTATAAVVTIECEKLVADSVKEMLEIAEKTI